MVCRVSSGSCLCQKGENILDVSQKKPNEYANKTTEETTVLKDMIRKDIEAKEKALFKQLSVKADETGSLKLERLKYVGKGGKSKTKQ